MRYPALLKMLDKYELHDADSRYEALRETLQEVILLGLYDAGFFNEAAFYGGTALRILHDLPRFSEDLDFSLLKVDPDFNLRLYKEAIITAVNSFGFDVTMEFKEKAVESDITSAFVKGNTIKNLININVPADIAYQFHKDQTIKIKLEIDVNPPLSFTTEQVLKLRPRAFTIRAFTLPCLYAGKVHAILCRTWGNRPKGRDWYDLVWYVAHGVELDLLHLQARLAQSCKYLESQKIVIPDTLNERNIKELLLERVASVDISKAKLDVAPFIQDVRELALWSPEFFKTIINDIKIHYPS